MKNLKIFPKMFIQIFSVLGIIILLIHLLVFYIFPKTYLENRKEEICTEANKISRNLAGKDINYVNQALDFYSKNSEIKAFVKGQNKKNEVQIKDNVDINMDSNSNSLIIEERTISLNSGKKAYLQFVSTADMQEDAKNLSFKFLPYSLLISLLFSIVVSLIYAKSIKNNIEEIKTVTDRMMTLDKDARLIVDSSDEIGHLKDQINDLYFTLLKSIDDLEFKNREIIKLERLKYDFLKGASHELKTPLASLKIILENMRDKIGRYKDRDRYLLVSLDIVDEMNQIVLEILSLSSVQELGGDKEWIQLDDVVNRILTQNQVLVENRSLSIDNYLPATSIFMNLPILKLVLSNIISNAVKHSDKGGVIRIGLENEGTDFVIENTSVSKENISTKAQSKKEGGLGLFVVKYLLEHEELSYRFEESSTGRRFVMVLPKK